MTHGCLEITGFKDRRKVFLHTYHTGMDIPLAVEDAIRVVAKRWEFNVSRYYEGDGKRPTRSDIWRDMKCGILAYSGLGYQPSVAAMVVAASPGLLEPFPKQFMSDLPTWGGQDSPYRLKVSESRWLLTGHCRDESTDSEVDNAVICDFNPAERLVDLFLLKAWA